MRLLSYVLEWEELLEESYEESDHLRFRPNDPRNPSSRGRILGGAGFFDQTLLGGDLKAYYDDNNRHRQHGVQDPHRGRKLDEDDEGLLGLS